MDAKTRIAEIARQVFAKVGRLIFKILRIIVEWLGDTANDYIDLHFILEQVPEVEEAQMRALVRILNGIGIIAETDRVPIVPIERFDLWRQFGDTRFKGAF